MRAALAIRDWIAEEGELEARIGINTGEALINLGAKEEPIRVWEAREARSRFGVAV